MSASATWQPIIDGRLWEAERLSGAGFPLRTVALELPGGGTCVISPTRGIDPAPIVERAGDVRYLLAPNHFHYMGIAPWLEKCPRALPVCGPVARPRLTKKVEIPWTDLEELAAALPEDASLLEPEGTRNGEVWLRVGSTWVVCDAFFNLPVMPSGALGIFCRLTSMAPGLKIGGTWKYLALKDRTKYAAWLERTLEQHPPERLIASHGAIAEGADLADQIRALVRARL
jgi:hypothetical protein